jgi:hypothetical protein
MIIENELVRKVSGGLDEQLEASLEVIGPNCADRGAAYIAEDSAICKERQDLTRKRRILNEARDRLRSMPIDT